MNSKTLYQKLRQLLSLILPLMILLTYISLLSEAIKYPGFIANHFYIDVKVYFAAVIVLVLLTGIRSKITSFILKVNHFFLPVVSLIYIVFSLLEGAHYLNYVLATYHFHLDGLVLLVLFSFSLFLTEKFRDEMPKIKGKLGITYYLLVILLVFFVIKNVNYVVNIGIAQDSYILFHLKSTYDDKMFYQWGKFYKFMVFVRENTPSDATIIIPPMEDPWLMGSGNDHFVRAFLFPRKIVPETKIITDLKNYGPNSYILITWGKEACKPDPECHGWPRQDIAAKRIIYKAPEPEATNVVEIKENATYSLKDSKYVYGIIEL